METSENVGRYVAECASVEAITRHSHNDAIRYALQCGHAAWCRGLTLELVVVAGGALAELRPAAEAGAEPEPGPAGSPGRRHCLCGRPARQLTPGRTPPDGGEGVRTHLSPDPGGL